MLSVLLLSSIQSPVHQITISSDRALPISPYIYGINSPEWAGPDLPYTLGRLGGNRMTAYNWETNASNAGNDYHNQNDGYMGASDEPGWTMRKFLEFDESHSAATIMTIPTAGYVSADKKGDGDVANSPNYLSTRFYKSLPKKGAKFTYPPDTTDRVVYQDECVAWLEKIKRGPQPLFFMLDNEPDLWGSTHSRIWPKNPTYAQIIDNNITFASAIKDVAPNALVFGPANYGWQGFHTFQNAPDANGRDFLDTYLSAMRSAGEQSGRRLLDVLDVHWYPEARGGGVRVADATDQPETAAVRIQSTRSLWDPAYVEESWIEQATNNRPIQLIPTIQKQIADHYPGTKFSISEYNYGGNKFLSGAIAQADALGIFGRYGVFAACNWGIGKDDVGQIAGFKSFLNFDGKGGKFLSRELAVSGETPAEDSVYASANKGEDGHVVLVAINKTRRARRMRFSFTTLTPNRVSAYTISGMSLTAPAATQADPAGRSLDFEEPPLSVTTFDVR